MDVEIIKEAFIEGYKQRAESSNLIFDNASKMYATSLFDKWIKGQKLHIHNVSDSVCDSEWHNSDIVTNLKCRECGSNVSLY